MIKKYSNQNVQNILNSFLLFGVIILSIFLPIHPEVARKIAIFYFFILIFITDYKILYTTFKDNSIIKSILLFLLFSILSYFWTENYHEFKSVIRTLLRYWIIPTIVLIIITKKEHLKYLISSFLVGMLINAILSLLNYFYNVKEILTFKFSSSYLVPYQSSHMEYSIYLAITTIIFFYYFINEYEKIKKILFLLFTVVFFTLLFIQYGRTGQIAFIFSAIILIILYIKDIKKIIISFIILILLIMTSYLNSSKFNDRINHMISGIQKIISTNNFNTGVGIRISAYYKILEITKSINVIYGNGIGDSEDTISIINKKLYGPDQDIQLGRLHQSFITMYTSLGLIGLILFISIFYQLIKINIKDRRLNFIRYVFLTCLFISLVTMDFYNQREILLLIAFFSSLIIIDSKVNPMLNRE